MKILLALLAAVLAILPARAATYTVTNNADAGPGTLRQAILDANANPGANTITFDPSLNGQRILLTSGQLAISNSVSILGPGPDQLVIDGSLSSRVFYIASNGVPNQVMLAGLAITNGYDNATGSFLGGGGIFNDHATLTVSNVTVSGSSSPHYRGGGIYNAGVSGTATLTVRNSTVSGNSASDGGGIYNDGYSGTATLMVLNSTVSGNSASGVSGGIFNDGNASGNAMLTVKNSTVSGNSSANVAGGIYNYGFNGNVTLTVLNSIVSGNSAALIGGGIYNYADNGNAMLTVLNSTVSGNSASQGGGFYNAGSSGTATLTILNSTLISNTAGFGGGIYNASTSGTAALTIQNSTLSGNSAGFHGGGIVNDGSSGTATLTMVNTLLAKGPYGTVNYLSYSGTVTNSSHNLSDDNSTTNSAGIPFATTVADLKLAPPAGNGGPTPTVALLPGSPAIDAGDNALIATNPATGLPVATDQRGAGHPRIVNGTVDIGAFESGAVTPETPSLVVTATNEELDPFDGQTSLREALAYAATLSGTNTITFSSSTANGAVNFYDGSAHVIPLDGTQLAVSGSVAILGPGPDHLAIDGNHSSRVFYIASNAVPNQVMLAGLTITNAYDSSSGGGGIYNDHAVLTVSNVTVSGNSATYGGGIYNDGVSGTATLMILNSTLSGNSAHNDGGGFYNNGYSGTATLTVLNSTLSGNSAGFGGGFFNFNSDAPLTVRNSTVSGNSANFGGGFYNNGDSGSVPLTVLNSTLSGNSAYDGGGFYNKDAPLTVQNSTLSGNSATNGGGIYNDTSTLTVLNSTLNTNSASQGGGIFNDGSSGPARLTMVDTLLAKGGSGENYYNLSGTVTNSSFNLSDDHSTTNSAGIPFATTVADLKLGPLADNGGPTLTVALLPGSPAINAGTNYAGLPAYDQRGPGHPRVVDGTVDIGAFESSTGALIANGVPVSGTEGLPLPNATVATFTNTLGDFSLSNYTATIDWGDGGSSAGTITQPGGAGTALLVSGSHTYVEEGSYSNWVTMSFGGPPSATVTATTTATISDAPLTPVTTPTVSGVVGEVLSGQLVASFTDGNPTALVTDFTATVNWGDGSPTSVGTISQPGGVGTAFRVTGSHTYAAAGTYTTTVNVNDVGGSTTTVSASAIINPAATATTLASGPNPSVFGQSVTFTATVSAVPPGVGTPSGTVTFFHGATSLGIGTLNASGQVTLTNSTLAAGNHALAAIYSGDSNFYTSSNQLTQAVNPATTTTTLTNVTPSLFFPGQNLTAGYLVSPVAPGAGTPTGTVTLTNELSAVSGPAPAGTLTMLLTNVGTFHFAATYSGDTNFLPSSSSPPVGRTVLSMTNPAVWFAGSVISNGTRFLQTTLMDQLLTLTNVTSQTLAAVRVTIHLSAADLAAHIIVYNASGTNAAGEPYLQYNYPVPPGGHVTFTAEYYSPDRVTVPNPTFTVELVTPEMLTAPPGTPEAVARKPVLLAPDNALLIDFATEAGATYYVLYKDNLASTNWNVAQPPVTGTGYDVQWVDDGPPKTKSPPGAVPNRFYEVLKAN